VIAVDMTGYYWEEDLALAFVPGWIYIISNHASDLWMDMVKMTLLVIYFD
jgi:hypothetical protein